MHQRLKGASVASYYPPRIGTIAQLRSLYPENELLDDAEEDWLEHLNVARSRGKAVPKKKRTAAGTFARIAENHRRLLTKLQNRRSTTRGSKRAHATRYPPRETLYIYCTREHWTAFIRNGKRQNHTGLKEHNHINHRHARMPRSRNVVLDYILLFTPISVFPLTTPCSFSNSSSQGILALR